jgi:CelD/BcsL family acetyltransferase involved in cellulose biosynthesis
LFRLKVARSAAEIDELRSAWGSLHLPGLSMFQSYLWNRLAAEVFAGREQPYFVFAESDSGAAIIPAVIDPVSKTVSFAGERLFDYRDYLAAGDPAVLIRAWRHLAELNLPLSITAISRPEAAGWDRLPKEHFSAAPQLLNREMAAEDFPRRHSRAFSRLRKLQRMGLHLCQYSGGSPIVRQIYERRAKQSDGDDLFRDPLLAEFMVAVCRAMGNSCEVFALEHGGTLVAALVTFRDHEFRRFYTAYYDRGWARYSPGVSLLFEIVRRSLEQGLNVDLMTGEQAYKMRIATGRQELFRVNATSSQLREAFPDSVRDVAA